MNNGYVLDSEMYTYGYEYQNKMEYEKGLLSAFTVTYRAKRVC